MKLEASKQSRLRAWSVLQRPGIPITPTVVVTTDFRSFALTPKQTVAGTRVAGILFRNAI